MEQVRARIEARSRETASAAEPAPERAAVAPPSASFGFDGGIIYRSSRGGGIGRGLYGVRMLLAPFVKFVFNIDPMVDALAIQARRNEQQASFDDDVARRLAGREEQDEQSRRAVQRLTAEVERLAGDMKGLRTLVESVAERQDAIERARAREHGAQPRGGRPDDEPTGTGGTAVRHHGAQPRSGRPGDAPPSVLTTRPTGQPAEPRGGRPVNDPADADAPASPPAADGPAPPTAVDRPPPDR